MYSEPRICFIDIETIGVNALKADLGVVAVFGWKFLDEPKAHSITLDEYGGFTKHGFSDKNLLKEALRILEKADLVVGHYSAYFDRKFLNGRLLINNLNPPPPTKMRDLCLIMRSVAKFSSNRLGYLSKILNLDQQKHVKTKNEWPGWWMRTIAGDRKALRSMAKYCEQDIYTTEQLYLRLRPFDNNHPRIIENRSNCGTCGGKIEYRGFSFVGHLRYRRFVCKNPKCRRWDRERNAIKQK